MNGKRSVMRRCRRFKCRFTESPPRESTSGASDDEIGMQTMLGLSDFTKFKFAFAHRNPFGATRVAANATRSIAAIQRISSGKRQIINK